MLSNAAAAQKASTFTDEKDTDITHIASYGVHGRLSVKRQTHFGID